ncbi:MAG: MaoC family dehydratase N-terminal domain-containing protein [Candidatus Binataceae bacterium]|jgi:acyl dehydratase
MADKSLIGKSGKPFTMPVEWGKVREFARAIKDRNPVYYDPEVAKKECGGIPITPTFLMASSFWQASSAQEAGAGLDLGFDTRRILHGEQEFEYFKPIFVGDVLTGVARVADIYEKDGGRGGKMTFAVVETEYTNQKGEKVAVARSVLIETGGASK